MIVTNLEKYFWSDVFLRRFQMIVASLVADKSIFGTTLADVRCKAQANNLQ